MIPEVKNQCARSRPNRIFRVRATIVIYPLERAVGVVDASFQMTGALTKKIYTGQEAKEPLDASFNGLL